MIYFLISIVALTAIVAVINKYKKLYCPVCLATFLTWTACLVALYLNIWVHNTLFLAILISVSLGAATERYGRKFGMIWKLFMVVFGAPGIYYLVQKDLLKSFYFFVALAFITVFVAINKNSQKTKDNDKFAECC